MVGVALELRRIIETNPIRVSYHYVCKQLLSLNVPLNSCTQATGWSSSVIKVGVIYVGVRMSIAVFKRRAGLGYG